ncbi:MAG: hypothetical protein IKJ99_03420 [Oscillospiraceae bacterium]|nr:hypothetical protein [Oscillospiraceae bacterium]
MSEYGLTPKGPNIKRLDTILADLHANLSDRWGVNTRQNPESLLCHLLTNFADRIAELWEFGEDVYYSQYPTFAEGISLDNAAQFGGSARETAAKSYYPIHCTGKDGTTLAAGTMISTTMNPTTRLTLSDAKTITRTSFNKAVIKVASVAANDVYTIAVNGAVWVVSPSTANERIILTGLADGIESEDFDTYVDEEALLLHIEAKDITSSNSLVLSENLTTETVTSVITFGTEETGDILLPERTITNIVKADVGLLSVINLCSYIAGRKEETDTEFRQSYADKIFNRSSMMLESIRSAILNNVQGVRSVAPYENPSHEYDEHGRPPHSIEIVVDGGDSTEIAKQILEKKAGGINTYGDTVVELAGAYDENITIRFNRPTVVYTWFRLGITLKKNETIPPNYVDLLRNVVLENVGSLAAGYDVVPQEFMSELYKACSGISYIDIGLYTTEDSAGTPDSYPDRIAEVTARQLAFTTEDMIEVAIDG